MRILNTVLAALFVLHTVSARGAAELQLTSPQGDYTLVFHLDEQAASARYAVTYQKQEIIQQSALGIVLKDGQELGKRATVREIKRSEVRNSWRPPYGTHAEYPENYNGATVSLLGEGSDTTGIDLVFRAYNEGVALRYVFRKSARSPLLLQQELTEFALPPGAQAWVSAVSQSEIRKTAVSKLSTPCERPLLAELSESLYVAIGEAAQIDYARMKLVAQEGSSTLQVQLESSVSSPVPFATPWRYIMAGESAGDILEHNYLVLNLNAPNRIEDVSWIKPGKVIRDMALTTQSGKACVDFAAEHGLQYVIESAGWYGNEFTTESDASTVTLDPARSQGPLDLYEVIRYGREKGIGIMVYVNRNQLEKQLDEILPLYQAWGIVGIKYGFVRTGSQRWSSWMHQAVRKAADHKMVLSIHDDYRPVGYSRTYPNLMTVEGIRGDEESPSNEHTLITMFTRMIAGAGDNTICYYAERVNEMGSHASQMAKSVCLYSPLTWLYWYDRPPGVAVNAGGAGGAKTVIGDEPELEFFDVLPTVWDDTRVIHSEVGKLGTIARRHGRDWFVGTVNGKADRHVSIPLDFLEKGQDYQASIYFDDPDVKTRTHVGIERMKVTQKTVLQRQLWRNNGMAMHIQPR